MAKFKKMLTDMEAPAIQALMQLIETQSKATLANWAIHYSEQVLMPIWEKSFPGDERPKEALEAARQWLSGAIKLPEAKKKILECHGAARDAESKPAAQAAARAIGQSASTIHSARHCIGLALYGALAMAYDELGTDAPWDQLDERAAEECRRMLEALRKEIIMTTNFDEIIDRRNTNALNTDGFRQYIFKADKTMEFPYKDEEFIRMWVADMEFATPKVIIDAMKERLDRRIFGYTMIFSDDYYKAFSGWCQRRYDWIFQKDHLVTSNGIIPALYELVEYITKPDEKVLFLTPSYAYFKYAADHHHREWVASDLINEGGRYQIDFEDLEQKVADEKTTLLILCNPHNPTGRVWRSEELQRLGEICIRHNTWIISDEIHCDLLRNGQRHIPLAKLFPEYDRIITCMAPSKTFNLAGLMFSNIIIPDEGLRRVWKHRHYGFDNPLSIVAAQAAYEKGEPWLEELQVYLDENFTFTKEYLAEHLPKARFEISEATYLAWVDVSVYFDQAEDLPLFFANKAGVLLEGGNMFVQNSDRFIRLNLACPRSLLAEGLKRICQVVD